MDNKLKLTTATRFDELVSLPDVTIKNSTVGNEFITSVYKNGNILAERIIEMKQAEHFEVQLSAPVVTARSAARLPK